MTVTVQIDTSTAVGRKLITELRRYPDVVRFVEPDLDIESLSRMIQPSWHLTDYEKNMIVNSGINIPDEEVCISGFIHRVLFIYLLVFQKFVLNL